MFHISYQMEGLRMCSSKSSTAGGSANPAAWKVMCTSAFSVAATFLAPTCLVVIGHAPSHVFGEGAMQLRRKKLKGVEGKVTEFSTK